MYPFLQYFLVEARGIEPLSENLLIQLSPGAVGYLKFPLSAESRHSSDLGILFLRDCLKG